MLNNKIMKQLIIIFSIIFPLLLTAQEEILDTLEYNTEIQKINDLAMIYKCSDNAIEFRWAPTNPVTWKMGTLYGYTFERMSANSDSFLPVENGNFSPITKDQWPDLMNNDNKYMAIAAECIYGTSETVGFGQAAQDMENHFTFNLLAADFNKEAAEASGLYFTEKDTSEVSFGVYRMYTYDPVTFESSDTAYLYASYKGEQKIYPPELKSENMDGAVKLAWQGGGQERSDNKLTAYYIERSTDGKSFERLNVDPYVMVSTNVSRNTNLTTYIDSVENGLSYYYRVIGIDAFADLTEPSELVEGMGIDLTLPPVVQNIRTGVVENNTVTLEWDNSSLTDNIIGFNVCRSLTSKDGFTKINEELLSKETSYFETERIIQSGFLFYYIETVGVNGMVAQSGVNHVHFDDEIAPQAPTNLIAEIDSNGLVLIRWDAPSDTDIKGYELFYANKKEHIFTKKSIPIIKNEYFIDSVTIKTLTEEIYYKIVAVDHSYNRSDDSEVFEAMRPDVIPPSASIFKGYYADEGVIQIEWIASTSTDVVSIELMRRSKDEDWMLIEAFDATNPLFKDLSVEEGVTYEYNLITTDDSGNNSIPERTLVLDGIKSFYLEEVQDLQLKKIEDNISLSWKYDDLNKHSFMIYKANDNGDLISYKKISGKNEISLPFRDNQRYSFAVLAKGQDGRKSKISKTVRYQ